MNLSSAESDEYLSNSLLSLLDYTPYTFGSSLLAAAFMYTQSKTLTTCAEKRYVVRART